MSEVWYLRETGGSGVFGVLVDGDEDGTPEAQPTQCSNLSYSPTE